MPFCNVKGHLLMCKRACFAMQKGTFYNPLCNLLIPWWLQRRFLMIMSWFANNNTLQLVRVFHKASPHPSPKGEGGKKRDTPLYLRGRSEEKAASPRPSPKGEGEQIARFPDVFERTEWGKSSLSPSLSEGRGRIKSEIPRCIWEDIKRCLRIFVEWFWG